MPVELTAQKPSPVRVRYCLYARKSTEEEDQQVLSIDSQIREMEKMAREQELDIVVTKKESHSAKEAGQRPVFKEIMAEIKQEQIRWNTDMGTGSHISAMLVTLGRIVDLMDQGLSKEIRTYGAEIQNNPNEKFLLMILG